MVSTSVADAGVLQPWPAAGIKAVVCDIEGTTTSISFVKDVLFPYVRQHVRAHLTDTWTEPETVAVVQLLRRESAADCAANLDGAIALAGDDAEPAAQVDAVVRLVEWQMDADRKATPLKQLQGQIWAKAYQSAAIKGHVYDDVPAAFDAWLAAGARCCIYSSGSVAAQKLLFGHSEHGDLLPRLAAHYDTKIGAKQVAASYKAICDDLALAAEQVLFLTDIVGEAKAAKEAGLRAVLVDRPGNAPLTETDRAQFAVIKSFAEAVVLEADSSSTEAAAAAAPTLKRKLDADEAEVAAVSTVDGATAAAKVPNITAAGGDDVELRPTKVAKTEAAADEVNSNPELSAQVAEQTPVEDAKPAVAPAVATNGVAEPTVAALDEDVPMESEAAAAAEAVVAAATVAADAIAVEIVAVAAEPASTAEVVAPSPEAVPVAAAAESNETGAVVADKQPTATETGREIVIEAEKPMEAEVETMEVDESEPVTVVAAEKTAAEAEAVEAAAEMPAEVAAVEMVEEPIVESGETADKPGVEPIVAGAEAVEAAEDTHETIVATEVEKVATEKEDAKDVVDVVSTTNEPSVISDAETTVSSIDQSDAVAKPVVDVVIVEERAAQADESIATATESPPTVVVVAEPILADMKSAKVESDEEPIVSELKPDEMVMNGDPGDEATPAAVAADKEPAEPADTTDSTATTEDAAEKITEPTESVVTEDAAMDTADATTADITEATVEQATTGNAEPIVADIAADAADADMLDVETTVEKTEQNTDPIDTNATMDPTEPEQAESEPTTETDSASTNGIAAVATDATPELPIEVDDPLPAQQQQPMPVLATELNTSSTTTTTKTTEVSSSDEAKEKVSRVEITIEQIEKEPTGQTKQTTTHIVKEISIKEQLVVGASSNKSEQPTAAAATATAEPEKPAVVANEKIVPVEMEKMQNGAEVVAEEVEPKAAAETSNGSAEQPEENGAADEAAELKNGAATQVAGELSAKTDSMDTAETEVEVAAANVETETTTMTKAAATVAEDADKNNSGNDSDKENDVSATKNGNNGTVSEVPEAATAADETPAAATNKPAKCLDQVAAVAEPAVVAPSATEVMTA